MISSLHVSIDLMQRTLSALARAHQSRKLLRTLLASARCAPRLDPARLCSTRRHRTGHPGPRRRQTYLSTCCRLLAFLAPLSTDLSPLSVEPKGAEPQHVCVPVFHVYKKQHTQKLRLRSELQLAIERGLPAPVQLHPGSERPSTLQMAQSEVSKTFTFSDYESLDPRASGKPKLSTGISLDDTRRCEVAPLRAGSSSRGSTGRKRPRAPTRCHQGSYCNWSHTRLQCGE